MRNLGFVLTLYAWVLVPLIGQADSIIIDGKRYTGITLKESSSRYYFTTSDGQAVSVGKDQLGPNDVMKGDGLLPEPEPVQVLEAEPAPAPEPLPVPAPEPVPEPTPEPKPIPAPQPEPAPEPAPAPVPVPAPEPVPAPQAEPAPAPEPAPEPTPEPEPIPTPAPVPEPATMPQPEAQPAPAPAPVAAPEPKAAPESATRPAPETEPALDQEPAPPPPEEAAPVVEAEEEPAVEPLTPLVLPGRAPLRAGAAMAALDAPGEPLEVNAVVLESGGARVVFVSVDIAAVDRAFVERVAERLKEKGSSITLDSLIVACTGRYTTVQRGLLEGPLNEALFGSLDNERRDRTANEIADAVRKAEAGMKPARIAMAEADAAELLTSRLGDTATVDGTLGAVRIERGDGDVVAYLVNFALHPPVSFGMPPQPGRGVPGSLAKALRDDAGRETPVLFVNAAAGDITVNLSAGEEQVGRLIAERALNALEGARADGDVALAYTLRVVRTPPTLLVGLIPEEALVHEVWLDQNVFVTVPGAAAGQIGLLLRVKAMSQGMEHVFVMSGASDYLGYLPTSTEFFAATPETEMAAFGPLVAVWCAEQVLPVDGAATPSWRELPELAQYESVFSSAVESGAAGRAKIRAKWARSAQGLEVLGTMARTFAPVPEQFEAIMAKLGEAEAATIARKLAAVFVRTEFTDFSAEDRVRLMGMAQGAGLPFDAVLLLQFLSNREDMPEQAAGIFELIEAQGYDLSGLRLL